MARDLSGNFYVDYEPAAWRGNSEESDMTLQSFIEANKIRMDVGYLDRNPNIAADGEWLATARHFRCVLRRTRQRLTIPFSQGPAISNDPEASDVLDCLASDAAGIENSRSFEDWCAEYGYDTDSRKAEKIYRACQRNAKDLKRFLGADNYEKLLWSIERQ